MDSLPRPLPVLIYISASVSTLTLVFSILIITVSPVLWVLPSLFLSTTAYHAVIILMSTSEATGSLRLFSRLNLLISYALTLLWAAGCIVAITITALLLRGQLHKTAPRGNWSMIVPCVFAFIESVVMGFVANSTRKERNRLRYADKWKWRTGHNNTVSAQWAFGRNLS